MVYMEQISHHPPISYILMEGPNGIYRYSGYSDFAIKASFNAIYLEVVGKKKIEFQDGSCIEYGNQQDKFGNFLFGQLHHQLYGEIKFSDTKNSVEGLLDIGGVKKRPKDYFKGRIEQNNQVVSDDIFGTYMGYFDASGRRFYDARDMDNYELIDIPLSHPLSLESDSRHRPDLCELFAGNIDTAQENKTAMEIS
mmetsp:Transcript_35773/g.54784  ORF Transcript_35773/g.54784 Transcript_35773/m.54784 type:complete len:195 (-) Transcript_35773:56-640(-)